MLLGREADSVGETHYAASLLRGEPPERVLAALVESAEAKRHLWRRAMQPRWQPPALSFDLERAVLAEPALGWDRYEELWAKLAETRDRLVIGQREYLLDHKRRFWELFNAVLVAIRDVPSPEVLEFGATQFSAMYALIRPDLRLDVCDRPAGEHYPGFTAARCRELFDCRNHYSVDLERLDALQENQAPRDGQYDLIVFTEVIEHIVADPLALLAWLLRKLKVTGRLYLTTPNFLRGENLELIRQGRNPQPLYPGSAANWDAHFHFREFVAAELFELVERAGGNVEGFYYSGCWDEGMDGGKGLPPYGPDLVGRQSLAAESGCETPPPCERGDLVFLLSRRT